MLSKSLSSQCTKGDRNCRVCGQSLGEYTLGHFFNPKKACKGLLVCNAVDKCGKDVCLKIFAFHPNGRVESEEQVWKRSQKLFNEAITQYRIPDDSKNIMPILDYLPTHPCNLRL